MGTWKVEGGKKKERERNLLPKGSRADLEQFTVWYLDRNLYGTHILCMLSCSVISDSFETPWIIALQAPLSMGFSRQEY